MKLLKTIFVLAGIISASVLAGAQQISVKFTAEDAETGEPVGFATASLTEGSAGKPSTYALTDAQGKASLSVRKSGTYTLKIELLGYRNFTKELNLSSSQNLGSLKMKVDHRQLDAARVSAVGNTVIIKKDTIEYNATAFKTTDNDVLEDLLKKLPGVEVAEDGGITVNGQTVKKITIDGKTFFLDDPQLASKNIPAKMVEKLKVVEKKSDQAEFSGFDDGEHETVIDLSIKPGMMKGAFGNVMAGGGHDVPSSEGVNGDWRYQGAAFAGKFTTKQQLSFILNGNNTNNRGFNDLSGSMMGNMRQGQRGRGQGGWGNGNGITTSWMTGVNGAWNLFDDKMDLSANYLYNSTDKSVQEKAVKTVFQNGGDDLVYKTSGLGGAESAFNNTVSGGHRFGLRMEHEFSKSSKLLFEPRVNFGTGSYVEQSADTTFRKALGGEKVNAAITDNNGANKNVSTSAFLLYRQKLGKVGRAFTVMGRFSFSNNDLSGINNNRTTYYGASSRDSLVKQSFDRNEKTTTAYFSATYTEPLFKNFFVEANYAYNWSYSTSDKNTFDMIKQVKDYTFSNNIVNVSSTHEFGANAMFQSEKIRVQAGFVAAPNVTTNETVRYDGTKPETMKYNPGVRWNWSPRAMVWADITDNFNIHLFYRGRTSQPSTSQLMPVPDNSNPLSIGFGNPSLAPYFNQSLRSRIGYNNKRTFFSCHFDIDASHVKDPIVNMLWYNSGTQYSMPFNCSTPSTTANLRGFLNIPLGKSNFTIVNMTQLGWSQATSYVGTGIDMTTYQTSGFYPFMEELVNNFADPSYYAAHITDNTTRTASVMERLRVVYRLDNLELQLSGRMRYNQSWYTLASVSDKTATFNNQARFGVNWTWDGPGITFKSEFSYNWYNGYSTAQPDEYVLDAEIQKLLFKKKVTLAVKGYDILGQAKNLTVTDSANYHNEAVNNTLGRYIIASVTYRFGTMDKSKMRRYGPPGGPR